MQPSRSNRRSRIVCISCNQKKIRCDLQQNPAGPCSKCLERGINCQIRPSKKLKRAHAIAASQVGSANQTARSISLPDTNINSTVSDNVAIAATSSPSRGTGAGSELPPIPTFSQYPAGEVASNGNAYPTASPRLENPRPPLLSPVDQAGALGVLADVSSGQSNNINNNLNNNNNNNTPCSATSSSSSSRVIASYLGDSGYMQIFSGDNSAAAAAAANGNSAVFAAGLPESYLLSPALQESYLATYFKHYHTWCPILNRTESGIVPAVLESALLQQALGLIGSQMEPPLIPHAPPAVHYQRAKTLFDNNYEKNPLLAISAIMLFYWWGRGPPHLVGTDTVWWWTGVAIRLGQQLGLHREPRPGQPLLPGETPGLRRRIWWTLFARERLSSLCTGRPCIINSDDCNIAELSVDDFPDSNRNQAEIMIYWVKLCAIIERVSNYLSRKTDSSPFPIGLAHELKEWMRSLPPSLQLPIQSSRTTQFDPNVSQIHLPYLTTVTLLYLSGGPHSLPKAYTTAVLASCCVARIFEDYTARGSMRFLQGMAGWSISIAILALLHACKVPRLSTAAHAHISVLRIALKEMAKLWHSSRLFDRGFDRIYVESTAAPANLTPRSVDDNSSYLARAPQSPVAELPMHMADDEIEWNDFFPYLTASTSPLAAILLEPTPTTQFDGLMDWPTDLAAQLQDFFEPFGDLNQTMFMT